MFDEEVVEVMSNGEFTPVITYLGGSSTITSAPEAIKLFEDDVVVYTKRQNVGRSSKRCSSPKFGLVIETSEYVSSSDSEDENDDKNKVVRGKVRVSWHPSGKEQVVKESDVGLVDRSVMPGEVMRRWVAGEDSQRGFILTSTVSCLVNILGSRTLLLSVDSRDIEPLSGFDDQYGDVCLDGWVGKIESIGQTVTLQFSDGARCVLQDSELEYLYNFTNLHDHPDKEFGGTSGEFYVGQLLTGQLENLENVTWTQTTKSYSPDAAKQYPKREVVVRIDQENVEYEQADTEFVDVQWLARYMPVLDPDTNVILNNQPPSTAIRGNDITRLKKLDLFSACAVQIGDRGYYNLKQSDLPNLTAVAKNHSFTSVFNLLTAGSNGTDTGHSKKHKHKTIDHSSRKSSSTESRGSASRKTSQLVTTVVAANKKNSADLQEDVLLLQQQQQQQQQQHEPQEQLQQQQQEQLQQEQLQQQQLEEEEKQQQLEQDKLSSADDVVVNDERHVISSSSHSLNNLKDDISALANTTEVLESSDPISTTTEEAHKSTVSNARTRSAAYKSHVHHVGGTKKRVHAGKYQTKATKETLRDACLQTSGSLRAGDRVAVEIIHTCTTVDVMWQDGSIERNIKSGELFPIRHLDELEFFPTDYILNSNSVCLLMCSVWSEKEKVFGVIQSVNHSGRTCRVRWIKLLPTDLEMLNEEELSVYDIKDHPEFRFRTGQIVIKLAYRSDSESKEKLSEDVTAAADVNNKHNQVIVEPDDSAAQSAVDANNGSATSPSNGLPAAPSNGSPAALGNGSPTALSNGLPAAPSNGLPAASTIEPSTAVNNNSSSNVPTATVSNGPGTIISNGPSTVNSNGLSTVISNGPAVFDGLPVNAARQSMDDEVAEGSWTRRFTLKELRGMIGAGQIHEIRLDGRLMVQWSDGSVSAVCPHHVTVLNDSEVSDTESESSENDSSDLSDDVDDDVDDDDEDDDDDDGWVTEEEDQLSTDQHSNVVVEEAEVVVRRERGGGGGVGWVVQRELKKMNKLRECLAVITRIFLSLCLVESTEQHDRSLLLNNISDLLQCSVDELSGVTKDLSLQDISKKKKEKSSLDIAHDLTRIAKKLRHLEEKKKEKGEEEMLSSLKSLSFMSNQSCVDCGSLSTDELCKLSHSCKAPLTDEHICAALNTFSIPHELSRFIKTFLNLVAFREASSARVEIGKVDCVFIGQMLNFIALVFEQQQSAIVNLQSSAIDIELAKKGEVNMSVFTGQVENKCGSTTVLSSSHVNNAASADVNNTAASTDVNNTAASTDVNNTATSTDVNNTAASTDVNNTAASTDVNNTAASTDVNNTASSTVVNNTAASTDVNNTAASTDVNNTAADDSAVVGAAVSDSVTSPTAVAAVATVANSADNALGGVDTESIRETRNALDKLTALFNINQTVLETLCKALSVTNDVKTKSKVKTTEASTEDVVESTAAVVAECVTVSEQASLETVTSSLSDTCATKLNERGFMIVDERPEYHKFKDSIHSPTDPKGFYTALKKEYRLLKSSLPSGILVKTFESRTDLFSVLIEGPVHTPYEDGLFLFDVELSADYPFTPPRFHYISYCKDRLNPNLYEDGKVCVSLLGTWSGRGTEVWSKTESSLLQVLVSIQGLILNDEPYYNEAGYEKQKGTQGGLENSRVYNEMAVVKLVQSMNNMVQNPVKVFEAEIRVHMETRACRLVKRLEHWLSVLPVVEGANAQLLSSHNKSASPARDAESHNLPTFPLVPVSKGFQLTLRKALDNLKSSLHSTGINC